MGREVRSGGKLPTANMVAVLTFVAGTVLGVAAIVAALDTAETDRKLAREQRCIEATISLHGSSQNMLVGFASAPYAKQERLADWVEERRGLAEVDLLCNRLGVMTADDALAFGARKAAVELLFSQAGTEAWNDESVRLLIDWTEVFLSSVDKAN